MMKNAKIIGTGSYLPERILSNADLEKIVETSDEWIVSRTGIKERRIVADGERTSDMAYQAALKAIEMANIDPKEIDLILVGTSSSDIVFPSTACLVQDKLGANGCAAFDLLAACSGSVYGLTTANAYIRSGMAKTVLVIGADTVSRFINYEDRNTCVLFGDGAGAFILQATDEEGIVAAAIHADGSTQDILSCPGHVYKGGVEGYPYIKMDGPSVFKFAVKALANVAHEVLGKSSYEAKDIDWLVPHQANLRIIEATSSMLGMGLEKVVVTVDRHGNTSAASVALAFDEAVRSGKIKSGDLVMLEAVGGGMTWGAMLLRY